MGATREKSIPIFVSTLAPSGLPAETFVDRTVGATSWAIFQIAPDGSDLTLTATVEDPAILWGYDLNLEKWSILEESWRTATRVVPAGTSQDDYIEFALPRVSALAIQYPLGVTAGTFRAEEIRSP